MGKDTGPYKPCQRNTGELQEDSKVMRQTGTPVWLATGRKPAVTDEPDALIGHVRVCGGSGGQPLLLPGTLSGQKAARRVSRACWPPRQRLGLDA